MKRLLLILWFMLPAFAETPPYRFLLVVDRSLSMNARKPAAIAMTRELVREGFQGQIAPGDTFELWTCATGLDRQNFPPQRWDPARRPLLAELPAQFLAAEKFQGRTRFSAVAPDLVQWIGAQPNALLLLLTDGDDPVMDLPFDIEINEAMAARKKKLRGPRRLFLASLLILNGRATGWKVQSAGEPLELPRLPVRAPEPPPVAVAQPSPAPPPPQPDPISPKTVDLPPGAKLVTSAPDEPAPAAEPPPAVELPRAVEQAAAPAPVPVTVAPAPEIIAPAPVRIPSPIAAPVETNLVEVSEPEVAPDPPAVLSTAVPGYRRLYYYAAGGVGLLAIAVLLAKRKPKNGASLISKSMTRD